MESHFDLSEANVQATDFQPWICHGTGISKPFGYRVAGDESGDGPRVSG